MSQASTHYFKLGQAGSRSPRFDKRIIVPISVVAYSSIVSPFLIYLNSSSPIGSSPLTRMPESHPENMIFWPAVTAISIVLAVRNSSRLALPPHIICLAAYLAFAGLTWTNRPLGFQSDAFVHEIFRGSDDGYIHNSACHAGRPND